MITPWEQLRAAIENRRKAAAERAAREEQVMRELTAAGEIYRRGVATVPAPPAEPEFSPRYRALIAEVQQLRLLRTPSGAAEMARRLSESEKDLSASERRCEELQKLNESLYEELRRERLSRRPSAGIGTADV